MIRAAVSVELLTRIHRKEVKKGGFVLGDVYSNDWLV